MKKLFALLLTLVLMASGGQAQELRQELLNRSSRPIVNRGPVQSRAQAQPKGSDSRFVRPAKGLQTASLTKVASKPAQVLGPQKPARKPSRIIPAKGSAILEGYMVYPYTGGYYSALVDEPMMIWADKTQAVIDEELGEAYSAKPGTAFTADGHVFVVGLIYLYKSYPIANYVSEFDADGELVGIDLPDWYFSREVAYRSKEGMVYGLYYDEDNTCYWAKAPLDNIDGLSLIAKMDPNFAPVVSLCYNEIFDCFYGINALGSLLKVKTDGSVEQLAKRQQLKVPDFAPYYAGMVYDSFDNTIYWNAQTRTASAMVRIDATTLVAERMYDFTEGFEFANLSIPARDVEGNAPAAPRITAIAIGDNAHDGTLTFSMPKVTANGSALSGQLEYALRINGMMGPGGTAQPGESVTVNLRALQNGENIFSVVAANKAGVGEAGVDKAWIGPDYPVAPADVTLTETELSWSPVTDGFNGGYIDPAAVTYQPYLNGVAIGTPTSETSVAVKILPNTAPEAYTATVTAIFQGFVSQPGSSAKLVVGDPLPVPQTFYPTESQWGVCQLQSESELNWQFGNVGIGDCFYVGYDPANALDAWLFLPPVAVTDLGHFLSISLDSQAFDANYEAEYFDLCIGTAPTPDAMTVLLENEQPAAGSLSNSTAYWLAPKAGTYYVGIHATSEPDMAGFLIKNLAVAMSQYVPECPAAVTNLSAAGAPEGRLSAVVSFNMPKRDMAGQPIPEGTVIKAVVEGVTHTTVFGTPGEAITTSVAGEQCTRELEFNHIKVTTSIGELPGMSAETDAYVGQAQPAMPLITKFEPTADRMGLDLAWTAVSEGDGDAYLDPAGVQYVVCQYMDLGYFGAGWFIVDRTTDLNYHFQLDANEPQDYYLIGVAAENVAGNSYINYGAEILGPAYKGRLDMDLAYATDDDPLMGVNPIVLEGDIQAGIFKAKELFTEYVPGYVIAAQGGGDGDSGYFQFPYLSTMGKTSQCVGVGIYVDDAGTAPEVEVELSAAGLDPVIIGTMPTETQEPGFKYVNFAMPEEYLDQPMVAVKLWVTFTNARDQLLLLRRFSYNTDRPSQSGISAEAVKGELISGGKGVINFRNLDGRQAVVTRIDGARVADRKLGGSETSISVDKGIYVVKAGDKLQKVVVK